MVTVHREEVEGSETHEMDILGPHASGVTSPLWSTVSTGHGISNEAQSVVSQAEGVTSICWRLIPIQLSFSVTGSGISDFEGLHSVEEPPRAHFFMTLEISMA